MTFVRSIRIALIAVVAATGLLGLAAPARAAFTYERFEFYASDTNLPADTTQLVPAFQPLVKVKNNGSFDGLAVWNRLGALSVGTADNDVQTMPQLRRAGAHPTLNITIEWGRQNSDAPDNFTVTLPPGMVGNPQAVAKCPIADFMNSNTTNGFLCPDNTQIGFVVANAQGANDHPTGRLFNLTTTGSEVARLGAVLSTERSFGPSNTPSLDKTIVPIMVGVRTAGDFSIDSKQSVPQEPARRPVDSGVGLNPIKVKLKGIAISVFSHVNGVPFLTNPTSCEPLQAGATSEPRGQGGGPVIGPAVTTTAAFVPDCGSGPVPFTPTMTATPDNDAAGAPAGYTVGIKFPYDENAAIYQSHVKKVDVTLPEGVALSAAAGNRIDGCNEQQFGYGNSEQVACPTDSEIGEVEVTSPTVDSDPDTPGRNPLHGKAYFATPTAQQPWRILMLIEDAGLRIKLRGHIEIDPDTGQIRNVFENLPPLPFTDFKLKLRGGDDAVLKNPDSCGTHSGQARLEPFSAASGTPSVTQSLDVEIDSDCPADPQPFAPSLSADSNDHRAGAPIHGALKVTRPDDNRLLRSMNLSLPKGMIGGLKHVTLCRSAVAAAGNCGPDSRVGKLNSFVGTSDSSQIGFPGLIFLSEPLQAGDPASLAIVVPGKVGPIDLGKVVIRARLTLRKSDVGVDVLTHDIPKIFGGIPLKIRKIDIDVDRDNFLRNPTSCAPNSFNVSFGTDGGKSQSSVPVEIVDCGRLAFKPRLRLTAGGAGATKVRDHTPLRALVSQTDGQANIASARVALPDILRPDTVNINKPGALCTRPQLDAAACPPLSQAGSAVARTPLLPDSLSGPVYFYQQAVGALPNLSVQLHGAVDITLDASSALGGPKNVQTVTTFGSVPDVPQSEFQLNIVGGSSGILRNFFDLCSRPARADATFVAHSGAVFNDRPLLEVEGCGPPKVSFPNSAKLRKSRISLPLTCESTEDRCRGSIAFSTKGKRAKRVGSGKLDIAAGESKRLSINVSKAARRTVGRTGKLGLTGKATLDDGTNSGPLTVKGKKQKRR